LFSLLPFSHALVSCPRLKFLLPYLREIKDSDAQYKNTNATDDQQFLFVGVSRSSLPSPGGTCNCLVLLTLRQRGTARGVNHFTQLPQAIAKFIDRLETLIGIFFKTL